MENVKTTKIKFETSCIFGNFKWTGFVKISHDSALWDGKFYQFSLRDSQTFSQTMTNLKNQWQEWY